MGRSSWTTQPVDVASVQSFGQHPLSTIDEALKSPPHVTEVTDICIEECGCVSINLKSQEGCDGFWGWKSTTSLVEIILTVFPQMGMAEDLQSTGRRRNGLDALVAHIVLNAGVVCANLFNELFFNCGLGRSELAH